MAVLSGLEISSNLVAKLRIVPYVPENVTTCAYDVTLGGDAYFIDKSSPDEKINVSEKNFRWELAHPGKAIEIPPKSSVLVHTHEFIGSMPGSGITTMARARSSLAARFGVMVSASGGWGDVGFNSRWTFNLFNSRNATVVIPVGSRIAQIVFLETTAGSAESYGDSGSYGDVNAKWHKTFDDLRADWSPSNMLPVPIK